MKLVFLHTRLNWVKYLVSTVQKLKLEEVGVKKAPLSLPPLRVHSSDLSLSHLNLYPWSQSVLDPLLVLQMEIKSII